MAEESWRSVLEDCAQDLRGRGVEQALSAVQASAQRFWRDPERHRQGRLDLEGARRIIVRDALRMLQICDEPLIERIARDYDAVRTAAIHPIPGALEAIAAMHAAGVRLALVTNGAAASQRAKIERFDLAASFDCILIEEECGFGKPDERIYRLALGELGCAAEQAWMVGDNFEWEVAAPQRLGLRSVWVNPGNRPPPQGGPVPFRTIDSLSDLLPDG